MKSDKKGLRRSREGLLARRGAPAGLARENRGPRVNCCLCWLLWPSKLIGPKLVEQRPAPSLRRRPGGFLFLGLSRQAEGFPRRPPPPPPPRVGPSGGPKLAFSVSGGARLARSLLAESPPGGASGSAAPNQALLHLLQAALKRPPKQTNGGIKERRPRRDRDFEPGGREGLVSEGGPVLSGGRAGARLEFVRSRGLRLCFAKRTTDPPPRPGPPPKNLSERHFAGESFCSSPPALCASGTACPRRFCEPATWLLCHGTGNSPLHFSHHATAVLLQRLEKPNQAKLLSFWFQASLLLLETSCLSLLLPFRQVQASITLLQRTTPLELNFVCQQSQTM